MIYIQMKTDQRVNESEKSFTTSTARPLWNNFSNPERALFLPVVQSVNQVSLPP